MYQSSEYYRFSMFMIKKESEKLEYITIDQPEFQYITYNKLYYKN